MSKLEDKMIYQAMYDHLIEFSIGTYPKYKANWHHRLIANALEDVESGKFAKDGNKVLMIFMPPRHGKQIGNNVPVFTDKGWKRHGELKVGDKVVGKDGSLVKILRVGEKAKQNVRVWFSGDICIDCHENHEWVVFDRSENKYRTLETRQIEEYKYYSGNRSRFQVDYTQPIKGTKQKLEINPYVLGVWLGDGKSSGGTICFHKKDREHISRIKELGYEFGNEWGNNLRNVTVLGIRKYLRKLNLLNNKHIPLKYLLAEEEERRELLRGLTDTDGSVGEDKRVRFVNINKRLIDDVKVLIESLGYRTCVTKQKACQSTSGIVGKSSVYTISFSPHDNSFFGYIKRKSKKVKAKKRLRGIVNIERIDESEGNCIEVEGGIYHITDNFIPTHNSQLATINFPAWYLGRNPENEVITASYSGDLAVNFGGKTRDIVSSPIYKKVFNTRLKRTEQAKDKWSTTKGGSYVSVGIGGAITGRGANILLIDDPIKNHEEAKSETYRDKAWDWYLSTAYTRLEPGGIVIVILTRWHLDDLAGRILAHKEFKGRTKIIKFPAIALEKEEYREIGEPLWEKKYPIKELELIREVQGTMNWSSLYQQEPILSENQEFKNSWFKPRTIEYVDQLMTRNFLTIDTAISEKASGDFTGICRNYVDRENNWNIWAYQMKINPRDLIALIFKLYEEDGYEQIGIEKTMYSDVLKYLLEDEQRKRNIFLPIVELHHNQVAKETRIRGLIPRYENKAIYHIEGQCKDLEKELLSFPLGVHDDIIDSLAYQLQIAEAPEAYKDEVRTQTIRRKYQSPCQA